MEIGALEAQHSFGSLLHRVERGEEIEITRNGKVVARLVPAEGENNQQVARAALERIRAQAAKSGLKFDWAELKYDRDWGRP